MEVGWPKVLGQGDEKSQNVWGRGVRWAWPLRGTPGTLQKQAPVGVKVHTRAFADPWTVVTCPPCGPQEATLFPGTCATSWGRDWRLTHFPHCACAP